jgi:hypothetical protein
MDNPRGPRNNHGQVSHALGTRGHFSDTQGHPRDTHALAWGNAVRRQGHPGSPKLSWGQTWLTRHTGTNQAYTRDCEETLKHPATRTF